MIIDNIAFKYLYYGIILGNFVCPKGISLYRRDYCINNKFSDIKWNYIYIKGNFFLCFENLKKIYGANPIEWRKHEKIPKKQKKNFSVTLSIIFFLKICVKISFFYIGIYGFFFDM